MLPELLQRALRVATGWVPGLGTFVEEALDHLDERDTRRSRCTELLDVEDREWRPDSSPAALLRADVGVVAFHGRVAERGDFAAWCQAGERVRLRLYTAPGGFGKTRLLRFVVAFWRGHGWDGGFLREGALGDDGAAVLFGDAAKPLLLVLDYAESRRAEVEAVVRAARASTRPVRVVLLARAEGDWWEELRRAGDGVGDFFQGPAVEPPLRLDPLTDSPEARRDSYARAVEAFARTLKKPVPTLPAPPLDDDDFDRVLLIHAAALAAVEGERIDAGRLLDWLLERERRGIERVRKQRIGAGDALQRGIEHAAALVTLAGGADSRAEVVSIISSAPALSDQPHAMRERIADALHVLYRGNRWCDGVEPDLVGEHLVLRVLHDAPELIEAAFGEGVPEARLDAGLTVLNRIAQRDPQERPLLRRVIEHAPARLALPVVRVAVAGGDPIGIVLAEVLATTSDLVAARQLDGQIPYPTTALRELGAAVDRILLADARASGDPLDDEAKSAVAERANNLSVRLADLGRRDDALAAIQEAVEIRRDLAVARPDAFRPYLALSLNNLSTHLSNLGRREDALVAIQEAVEIRRDLAAARPDAFRPALAASLNNLSNHLSNLGRREDALAAIQEAVEIRRGLAAARPDAFRPDLALSLNNLSNHLSNLGRREDALVAIQEAVEIRRDLAVARPDAFRPNLATSLGALHSRLRETGDFSGALAAIHEAFDILEPYFRRNPGGFAGLMGAIVKECERTAGDVGIEPDRPRLDAIRQILARVEADEPGNGEPASGHTR